MTTPAEETVVDHVEIASVTRALRDRADELETLVTTAPERIIEQFTKVASQYTRDGNIAPIYADLDAATKEALNRVKEKAMVVVETLRNDAETLDRVSRASQETADDAAGAIDSIDV